MTTTQVLAIAILITTNVVTISISSDRQIPRIRAFVALTMLGIAQILSALVVLGFLK